MKTTLLCWVLTFSIALAGCASTRQSIKGAPLQLASIDRAVVQSSLSSPRRLAVVVGINKFDDRKWGDLTYPVKDAEDFASVLNDQRFGQFDKVITLTTGSETTRKSILTVLDEIQRQNLSRNDTIIFYVSAHGTIARTKDGKLHQYVVTRDTRFNDIPATAVDINEIKNAFAKLNSRKKALIFAFCHSGQGKSQINDSLLAELKEIKSEFFVKPIDVASEATIVLAASAWGETAREDRRLENDIYTHFLIEGIKGQDRNGDGAVTITEAHDYAREQTYYYTHGEQRPSMESIILGGDPIILSGRMIRSGKPVIYDYSHRYENMVVFVDGEKKGTLPLGIAVEPGNHLVEVRASDSSKVLYDEVLRASDGQQISLPLLLQGYEQGTSFRIGYQGFLTEEVDRSVSKPLVMYGLSYTKHAYFGPRLGFRADIAYGSDEQTLDLDPITSVKADVSQTTMGFSLLYRYAEGGNAFYAGPRLGWLFINRDISIGGLGQQSDDAPTLGGVIGMHFRYKRNVSFALENTLNYTSLELGNSKSNSFYYNVFANLSANF